MVKTSAAGVVGCIGLAVALAACSSPHKATPARGESIPGTISPLSVTGPAASPAPAPVPAGYKRIGGPAHGLSFAIPDYWVLIDPTPQAVEEGYKRAGASSFSLDFVLQATAKVKASNGLFAADLRDATRSPRLFAPDMNAYCASSGVAISGSGSIASLRSLVPQFQQLMHAVNMHASDINVGGIPALEVSYTLNSRVGTLYAIQLQVLPTAYRGCFVTLTATRDQLLEKIVPVIASTALFS
jgi:hypothetical protein